MTSPHRETVQISGQSPTKTVTLSYRKVARKDGTPIQGKLISLGKVKVDWRWWYTKSLRLTEGAYEFYAEAWRQPSVEVDIVVQRLTYIPPPRIQVTPA